MHDTHHGRSIGFGRMEVTERERSLVALEEAIRQRGGDPLMFMRRLPADPSFTRGLARHIVRGGSEWPEEGLARRIMGNNFWGRDEWAGLGVTFSGRQAKTIGRFPWNEEILDSGCPFNPGKAVRETHFAFLGLARYNGAITEAHGPLTIMAWQKIHPAESQPRIRSYPPNCWYSDEQFAAVSLDLCWHLALKEIVPRSSNTSWADMQGMIPEAYEVPSPVVEVTKNFLYYKRTGLYLNRNHYGATSALDSFGLRVIVGYYSGEAVNVNRWSGRALAHVGLSLVRKSGA